MNRPLRMLAGLVLLSTTPILAGCANNTAFTDAAHRLGVTAADADGTGVPKLLPTECYVHTGLLPKAQVVGADPHVVVRSYEKTVIPGANRKLDRCVGYAGKLLDGLFPR